MSTSSNHRIDPNHRVAPLRSVGLRARGLAVAVVAVIAALVGLGATAATAGAHGGAADMAVTIEAAVADDAAGSVSVTALVELTYAADGHPISGEAVEVRGADGQTLSAVPPATDAGTYRATFDVPNAEGAATVQFTVLALGVSASSVQTVDLAAFATEDAAMTPISAAEQDEPITPISALDEEEQAALVDEIAANLGDLEDASSGNGALVAAAVIGGLVVLGAGAFVMKRSATKNG